MRVVGTARSPGFGSGVNNENIGMYNEPSAIDHVHSMWDKWADLELNPPWIKVNSLSKNRYSASGNLLYIQFEVKTPTATPGTDVIAVLPVGARPSTRMSLANVLPIFSGMASFDNAWWLFIETTGEIHVWMEDVLSFLTNEVTGVHSNGTYGKLFHDDS